MTIRRLPFVLIVGVGFLFFFLWSIGWPPLAPAERVPPEMATVMRVIDGDTVELSDGRRVRYIGIDAPEAGDCFADEATERNRELVMGKEIRLVRDTSERDQYERLLRYVYVEDTFVNGELVAGGYARTIFIRPDTAQYDELRTAQEQARQTSRGLWGACR